MSSSGKWVRIAGLLCLLIFVGLLGYACYEEQAVRKRFTGQTSVDFGFLPVDLLQGRTHYERREEDKVVVSLNTGPKGEMRGTIARAAAGVGLLGMTLVLFSFFLKGPAGGVSQRK